MQKTIFITITRSFITRNILRYGTLDLLKKDGYQVCVFFQTFAIPNYLKEEFEDEQVKLFACNVNFGRWHRRFSNVGFYYLILTDSTIKCALFFREKLRKRLLYQMLIKSKIIPYLRLAFLNITSKINILKFLYRFVEFKFFPELNSNIQFYFDKYRPNLVFSTSINAVLDISFIKEAKRRKIPTVSMPKSWDVMTAGYLQFIPDYFLVPNEPSKNVAVNLQNIPPDKVYITGMPQFDWYVRKDIIKSREEHLKNKGLNPALPLIFFGSEGVWAPFDYEIAEKIYEWIVSNKLVKPCQMLARAHFTNADQDVFKNLRNKEKVAVDKYRITNFLTDRWDPDKEEMIDFVNSLYHCDIMINAASTLSLDAACFDKPIINISFGCIYEGERKDGKDMTTIVLYAYSDHYQWVAATGGAKKVNSFDELKEQINKYLLNPKLEAKERELLRRELCYKVDGKSSERIVNVLNKI